jgi:hypothetical protein
MKYAVLKGNTRYYSDPGCSIDPDPQIIQLLQILGKNQLSSSVDEKEKGLKEWHKICHSPQKVRVLGIPFYSHFAHVMVKADYDMKMLVDGSDTLNLPGFNALTKMTLQRVKTDLLQGGQASIPLAAMNRFWFYPGENC